MNILQMSRWRAGFTFDVDAQSGRSVYRQNCGLAVPLDTSRTAVVYCCQHQTTDGNFDGARSRLHGEHSIVPTLSAEKVVSLKTVRYRIPILRKARHGYNRLHMSINLSTPRCICCIKDQRRWTKHPTRCVRPLSGMPDFRERGWVDLKKLALSMHYAPS